MAQLTILIGGSAANPFTIGHQTLLSGLRDSFDQHHADMIYWIPSGSREDKKLLDSQHRVSMTMLGIPNEWLYRYPLVRVDFSDVYHKNTSTIDWLDRLNQQFPGADIIWYTGVDSVVPRQDLGGKFEMQTWGPRADELVKNYKFLILPREGYPDPDELHLPENFRTLHIPTVEISSTMVRNFIKEGKPFEHLVPYGVGRYIKAWGLYGYTTSMHELGQPIPPELFRGPGLERL